MIAAFFRKNFDNVVAYMYRPKDPSSLGVIRILFGLLMLLDLPEERGGSEIFVRYGNPQTCHFPLFDFIKPLNYELMSILYGVMFIGCLGIMLGLKFRISVLMFGVPYWYIFFLDKSFWNNHTYLYGILTILFLGTSANHYCSLDGWMNKNYRNKSVPYWNYFILKFQFFILYFLAGVKKTDSEWLEGYAMSNMGNHWVFLPFRILLTTEQIDYLIIHWFGFLLDLTIGFWMLIEFTRPVAMIFCGLFHLMNSRMFSIGMFPYVCLATMPLFCEENWPKKLKKFITHPTTKKQIKIDVEKNTAKVDIKWKHRIVLCLLLTHCTLQFILPFSHSITKGYNNWTKGLYGYSWDMMIHGWDTILVVVKIVENDTGQEHFLDSSAWTLNDRWTKHADMSLQYAQCLEKNLADSKPKRIPENISIYIDVWCSMNGRFQQRMFDPHYDLLKANWSVFREVEWLLPLLSEFSSLRERIGKISKEVHSWSNYSEIFFVCDFPGLYLENYVSDDLNNVSLTILEGNVVYENEEMGSVVKLTKGQSEYLQVGSFHKIHTIGNKPSCFSYSFINSTKEQIEINATQNLRRMYSPFPLIEDLSHKFRSFSKMFSHIHAGLIYLLEMYQ